MSTYGIDLGTTYSCIATLDRNGNPEIIKNQADASDTLASAAFFESADNVVIGNAAKDMIETDGERVVQYVKREIGKPNARTYEFDGKSYTPVEISSLYLKRLKQMVEEQGGSVDEVVITCPAYFGLEERNATGRAGELAGFKVLNLIDEPVAAALSYCARQFQEERTLMVYDLGGGTFDVTIIKMSLQTNADGNEIQVVEQIETGGNDELGGKDWDDKLFDYILSICCDENGVTPEDIDVETRQVIRSKVEVVKKKLSNVESAKVRVSVNGAITNVVVTREDFENLTADKVAQTMTYVEDTLARANNIDIDMVLLVGGSTYMPMIRNAVEARFPGKVQIHEPDRAVAMGAAIYANMLVDVKKDVKSEPPEENNNTGKDTNNEGAYDGTYTTEAGVLAEPGIKIAPKTPRSFGPGVLNSMGEYIVDNIIKVGVDMPALATKVYSTPTDNMEMIILRAFENMSKEDSVLPCVDRNGEKQPTEPADRVKLLGDLKMYLPAGTPAGSPIEVTFEVEAIGVYVKATNLTTGEVVETTITMNSDIDMEKSAVHELSVSGE